MSYTHIVLDVDGTTLDSHHQLSPRVERTLRAASAAGVGIIFATGKQYGTIAPLVTQLDLSGDHICLNGAAIVESTTRLPRHLVTLAEADRVMVLESLSTAAPQLPAAHFSASEIYVDERMRPYLDIFTAYGEAMPTVVESLLACALPAAAKILLAGLPADVAAVRVAVSEQLGDRVTVTTTMPEFLEFFHRDVNKGAALRQLASDQGIDLARVIAIGDGENDVPMLQAVGMPVAMGNARPQALAVARRVAPTNDEDGVAVALEGLLEGISQPVE
jgi:Cof subfamily protein (haloacid dehalogenase superfamily)